MFIKLRTFIAILILFGCHTANADLAIIVHPDYQGGELDQDMLKQIFLGETMEFPSGHKAIPANHEEGSPDRKDFFEYVLDMSETRHKRYWSRKLSTGKKNQPEELDSHAQVLKWISETPLGISYIDKSKVNDSVKILFTVYVFKDI